MLISFTVENFKSIRDLQTLSLDARSDTHLEESHVIADGTTRLLAESDLSEELWVR